MQLRRSVGFVLLAFAGSGTASQAAVFCVSNEAELTQAFATAGTNAESDEIRLRVGRYDASAPTPDGWQVDLGDGTFGLALVGGYLDAACTMAEPDARLTVLDGKGVARPVTIDTSANAGAPRASAVVVRSLTFENGTGGASGGLKISDSGPIYGGTILIEGNIFRANVATEAGGFASGAPGALYAATDGPTGFGGGLGIVVRGNLFVGNSGPNPGAMFLFSNNEIAITNNTFSGNRATDAALDERLIADTFSLSNVEYANNVFFDNAAADPDSFDLRARTARESFLHDTKLFDNILQRTSGTAAVSEGNMTGDPAFVDPAGGDYSLSGSSPALDAGKADPLGGLGTVDVRGLARVIGTAVDLGAFEHDDALPDPVFTDSFE